MIPVGWTPPPKRRNPHVFEEFPWPGLSVLEFRDANCECKHERLPHDNTPACGCWTAWGEEEPVAEVIPLPVKKQGRKRRAA